MLRKFWIGIILLMFIFGCSSKEGIVLEDETPESLFQKAKIEYDNKNFQRSIQISQMLLDNFPTTDLHIDAQLLMAKSLGGEEKFEDQFDLLLRILKENIIPERVPQIYMQIGEYYEHAAVWNPGNITSDTLDLKEASNYYRKAVFYPNSDDRATKAAALYRAALMNAKMGKLDIAKKAYAEVIDSYPESPYSNLARTKLLDPSNTEELVITPEMMAQKTAEQPPVSEEQPSVAEESAALPQAVSDSLNIELPADESDQPVIIDTTQTILPDSE